MRKPQPPKRRSVLRVEELIARSLPAVLNPAVAIAGDTAIVSSAGDEPADDTTSTDASSDTANDAAVTDIGTVDSSDASTEVKADDTVDLTTVDDSGTTPNIFFKPMYFGGLSTDSTDDSVTVSDVVENDSTTTDDISATDSGSTDEITADGTDATATNEADTKPNIFFRPLNWSGIPADQSSDETTVDDSAVPPDANPVVCYFGGINERNLNGSEADSTESTDPAIDDGSTTSTVDLTGTTDATKPNIFFRPQNWDGMTDNGAADDSANANLDTTNTTDVVEDPSFIAYDAGVPVPGDQIADLNIQTFGGAADDGVSFLAYSSVPPAVATPVVIPVAPAKTDVNTPEATPTIDGSAWTFYANKREEVTSTPNAQTSAIDSNKVVVVPPTTQPSEHVPAASTSENWIISLDGTSVKKLFGELSVDQK